MYKEGLMATKEIHLRLLSEDCVDAFIQLSWEEAGQYLEPALRSLNTDLDGFRQIARQTGSLYGVLTGDEPPGSCPAGYCWLELRGEVLHLHGLAFYPEQRGQGLGGAALELLARQYCHQAQAMELGVHDSNAGARRLYERHYFVLARRKEELGFSILQRDLRPDRFWQDYLASLPPEQARRALPRPPAWAFGDSPELADELANLVIAGKKTATCSLLWEYQAEGEQPPQAGEISIVTDGRGEPQCLLETVQVTIQPYEQVPEEFAWEEGEGDRSLAHWRKEHWRYFGCVCLRLGREPAMDMPLVCERFRVAWIAPTSRLIERAQS